MKKRFYLAATALLSLGMASAATYTLDLSKAGMTFDSTNGAWTSNLDEDATVVGAQIFEFTHGCITDWNCWWGFTASNHADNTRKDDTMTYQYSNMAAGGIVLDTDGKVALDDFGMPVVSAEMPYMVGYYGSYYGPKSAAMTFAEGKTYEPVGVYVNNNVWPYYSLEYGDAYSRPFTNGDRFALIIHGVAPDGTEKTVETDLASGKNGDLTINRQWKYVDLSALGAVNEIYFTVTTTDKGLYGDNTPGYFCLDKMTVRDADSGAVAMPMTKTTITYDRASATVNISGADFAQVYDSVGHAVMSSDSTAFSINDLTAGVYIVRAGDATLKIAR